MPPIPALSDDDRFVDPIDMLEEEPPDAVDRVVEVAGMVAVFAAERLLSIAHLQADARRRGPGMSTEIRDRSVRLELASALRITEYAAGELLALADAVVHRFPVVYDSLHQGQITERHAQILTSIVDTVEPSHRGAVLERGLALALEHPVGTFRRLLSSLVETIRAATLDERYAESLSHRRVVIEAADDGMSWLHAYLPAVEAHAIFGRLTGIAGTIRGRGTRDSSRPRSHDDSHPKRVGDDGEGDTRTLHQVRADALCDLLIDGDTSAHPDAARGIRANVVVTVPALSLLSDDVAGTVEPAVVEGIGPIPIGRARQLCGGSEGWMRVLTHPETGMVLSVGRDRYQPPPSLQRLVKWRSARCMAPGCGIPASRCQIDHTIAWEHGGTTSLWNHAPLCQGHHTIKHHGGWVVRQIEGSGGTIEWTSPTGRRYAVRPERPTPAFSPSQHEPAPAPF